MLATRMRARFLVLRCRVIFFSLDLQLAASGPAMRYGSPALAGVRSYPNAEDYMSRDCQRIVTLLAGRVRRVPHTFALFANVWACAPLHSAVLFFISINQ